MDNNSLSFEWDYTNHKNNDMLETDDAILSDYINTFIENKHISKFFLNPHGLKKYQEILALAIKVSKEFYATLQSSIDMEDFICEIKIISDFLEYSKSSLELKQIVDKCDGFSIYLDHSMQHLIFHIQINLFTQF